MRPPIYNESPEMGEKFPLATNILFQSPTVAVLNSETLLAVLAATWTCQVLPLVKICPVPMSKKLQPLPPVVKNSDLYT